MSESATKLVCLLSMTVLSLICWYHIVGTPTHYAGPHEPAIPAKNSDIFGLFYKVDKTAIRQIEDRYDLFHLKKEIMTIAPSQNS